MFKTAVVASALLQVSSTKILESDHALKAVNPQMVEAINVSLHFNRPNACLRLRTLSPASELNLLVPICHVNTFLR
jgi:hypothetical protein